MKELWYVSCSPRNPAKIRNEVELLAKLEGEDWNAKDSSGKHITQVKFARMLSKLDGFEGEAAGKESAFSARDRVAPMKTYGFAYVDRDGKIRITKAGRELIKGEDEERVFLMQMLKWQYPSVQHGGPEYLDQPATLFEPKKLGFSILPFIFTLQVAKKADGLTKREIALFLLPHRRMSGVSKVVMLIRKYRMAREKKKGRVAKRDFDDRTHVRLFKKIYADSLVRQTNAIERKRELNKKVSNSRDVADACIRLFRYTGIFATHKDRLVLNNTRAEEIAVILSRKWKSVDFYKDAKRFNAYFGDPDKPGLPFFDTSFLVKKTLNLVKQIEREKAHLPVEISLEDAKLSVLKKLPKSKLLKKIKELTQVYRNLSEMQLLNYLRSARGQQDVLEFYEAIVHREVADPATFFEWNTWRALLALDESQEIIPYLKLDDSLRPIDCAKGNTPDILAKFKNYVVAVEVTLTSGRRQYITETEPVTFHVGKCQKEENTSGNQRKVFGLFIAPQIHKHAAHYFQQYIKQLEVPDYGHVTVIPLDLATWKDILKFASSLGYLRDHALGELLASIEQSSTTAKNVEAWLVLIPKLIVKWKHQIAAT